MIYFGVVAKAEKFPLHVNLSRLQRLAISTRALSRLKVQNEVYIEHGVLFGRTAAAGSSSHSHAQRQRLPGRLTQLTFLTP